MQCPDCHWQMHRQRYHGNYIWVCDNPEHITKNLYEDIEQVEMLYEEHIDDIYREEEL